MGIEETGKKKSITYRYSKSIINNECWQNDWGGVKGWKYLTFCFGYYPAWKRWLSFFFPFVWIWGRSPESLTSGFKSSTHHLLCEDRKQCRGSEDDPSFGSTTAGRRTEVQSRRRLEQSSVLQHETETQWSKSVLTGKTTLNFPWLLCINLMYPSGKQPIVRVWKYLWNGI